MRRRFLADERAMGSSVDGLDLLLRREGQVEPARLARPVAPGVGGRQATVGRARRQVPVDILCTDLLALGRMGG